MCKWGTNTKVNVIRRANPFVEDGWHEIYVDSCIANEIQELNDKGIITLNCCCGHGKGKSSCLVEIECKDQLEKLGYEVGEYKGMAEIELKSTKNLSQPKEQTPEITDSEITNLQKAKNVGEPLNW